MAGFSEFGACGWEPGLDQDIVLGELNQRGKRLMRIWTKNGGGSGDLNEESMNVALCGQLDSDGEGPNVHRSR